MSGAALSLSLGAAIPLHGAQIYGIRLVGVNADTGKKLLFTAIFIVIMWLLRNGLHLIAKWALRRRDRDHTRFWTRQIISICITVVLLVGLLSIWFNDPTRLATALGLVSAGVAVALQRVITAIAAYFVILRSRTFIVGDRIAMGGVRGDVIKLGFIQTTLMEMGEPPPVQDAEPAVWVESRQYTGRIVMVTNDTIFNQPVYNYTREFPYIWGEMHIPISYKDDRVRAEQILLEATRRHTVKISEISKEALASMERRYSLRPVDLEPRVYYRLTDNWIELSLRFIVEEHGVRAVKDAISRDVIDAFDAAGIGVASGTYAVVEFPPVRIEDGSIRVENGAHAGQAGKPAAG